MIKNKKGFVFSTSISSWIRTVIAELLLIRESVAMSTAKTINIEGGKVR